MNISRQSGTRTAARLAMAGAAAAAVVAGFAAGPASAAEAPAQQAAPGSASMIAPPCRLGDLHAGVSAPEPAGNGSQDVTRVVWTNLTDRTCTMNGYGGADLRRTPADPGDLPEGQRGLPDSISVPRSTATQPAPVQLAPGQAAHSTITYLPLSDTDVNPFRPDVIVATPPNETHSVTLPWRGGNILRQDGATHPGTFLGPVEPGLS